MQEHLAVVLNDTTARARILQDGGRAGAQHGG
jgi:hypothetical protein